jgi:hypothetical protein
LKNEEDRASDSPRLWPVTQNAGSGDPRITRPVVADLRLPLWPVSDRATATDRKVSKNANPCVKCGGRRPSHNEMHSENG